MKINYSTIVFTILILFIYSYININAQFVQQGPKLVGTGAVGQASQGYSVSISSDGNTAIVGGYWDNNDQGAVWIYTLQNGVWTQQGSKLIGTGAVVGDMVQAQQGYSVSISADGNTAIEGGYADNNAQGAAWIFTRQNGVWTQQGSKLIGTGVVDHAAQGESVSISADGNTVIVGGADDNNTQGAAWIFTRQNGVWTQQGSKLIGTGAVGDAEQGGTVAISGDGNTAIVGGAGDNNNQGAVWIFTRQSGVWTQQGSKLIGTGAVGQALQGASVSISSDGNTAIVSGFGDNNNQGAVWIYTRQNGVWTQQGSKLIGTGAVGQALQGRLVSISANGNTAIVGGPLDNNNQGAVWIYTRQNGVWTQQGSKLIGTGAVGQADQGISVSISADGNTAIVGGFGDNNSQGAVWIFVNNSLQNSCPGIPTVVYAGKTYNTVAIGDQCWLKENLNVGTQIIGGDQTNNGIIEKWCYNDDPNNCTTYGGLYEWAEAVAYTNGATNTTSPSPAFTGNIQGICPSGWHIPTLTEYQTLGTTVSNNSNALKAVGQGTGGGAGTNTSGFSALLAGDYYDLGGFVDLGAYATFWSSTELNTTYSNYVYLYGSNNSIYPGNYHKVNGFSVRCLNDIYPLPVELGLFTAISDGRTIQLNWETKTEKNSNKFNIERKTIDGAWASIGSVKASVLSNSPKQYSYIDKNLQSGKYQYRLKMIDNDGTFEYSKVIETEVALPNIFALSQNYPNPFNPNTVISYSLPLASEVKLIVYNSLGQTVKVLENGFKSAGNYSVNFNASELSSGTYFYKIEAGQFSQIKKMMLLK
jgi:uncharacterized protein (TIGR02145 family)